mmetsp:Transcript_69786/g.110730  ORF Transcript_69786/g.110730 Transcript_69786/m.110730 type:complete len:215 (+) Transcript_69786:591-1235(+)
MQRTTATAPNMYPRYEEINPVAAPQRIKTVLSASEAVISKKLSVSLPPSSRCGRPYAPKMMPASKVAMIPEKTPVASAAAYIAKGLHHMKKVAICCLPCSCFIFVIRIMKMINEATSTPNTIEPNRSCTPRQIAPPKVMLCHVSFIMLNMTTATASLMVDSPNTIIFNRGSTFNALYVTSVATGSTAEIKAPKARFDRKSVTACRPKAAAKYDP